MLHTEWTVEREYTGQSREFPGRPRGPFRELPCPHAYWHGEPTQQTFDPQYPNQTRYVDHPYRVPNALVIPHDDDGLEGKVAVCLDCLDIARGSHGGRSRTDRVGEP